MKLKNKNGNLKIAANRFKFVIFAIVVSMVMVSASCSDGDGGSETLITKYSYNLTANATYYYVYEYHAYYNGNYVYTVHDCIVHYFLKTNSNYKNKTGNELCDIVRNRTYTPKTKATYVVEGDKTRTINVSQSNGSTIQITMNLPDGTPYESWVYK